MQPRNVEAQQLAQEREAVRRSNFIHDQRNRSQGRNILRQIYSNHR
jgi:hypothetical protein